MPFPSVPLSMFTPFENRKGWGSRVPHVSLPPREVIPSLHGTVVRHGAEQIVRHMIGVRHVAPVPPRSVTPVSR